MMDESTGAACLLIAVLHRATLDARRGDLDAARWLRAEAPGLLTWFDIEPSVTRRRVEAALTRAKGRRIHANVVRKAS